MLSEQSAVLEFEVHEHSCQTDHEIRSKEDSCEQTVKQRR